MRRLLDHNLRNPVVLDGQFRHYRADAYGLGIQRGTLFGLLHEAIVTAGVPARTGCEIVDIEPGPPHRLVDAAGRRHGPFELVLVCDGADSALRSRRGTVTRDTPYPYGALWIVRDERDGPADTLRQRFDGSRRMVGILPIGCLPRQPQGTRRLHFSGACAGQ